MGITEAIARVRASAKKAGLDSALATLGAGLKSTAIPAPLRPAATRIATLIGAQRTEPRDVASLERALEHAHGGAHGAGDVCPFTGLRADGSVADPHAAGAPAAAAAVSPPNDVSAVVPTAAAAAASALHHAQPVPVATDASSPEAPDAVSTLPAEPAPARAEPAATPPFAAPSDGPRPQKAKASGKEKLAGEQNAAKTTARSANKSAAKQTNGRAPSNRKKS